MRFGFAVKILGRSGLKSNDARRWQSNPHLSISIGYLTAILNYLDSNNIRMYRISSDFAPYITHPDMPGFHNQINECTDELHEVGSLANVYGIRLSFHPSQYIVLNSPDERIAAQSIDDLKAESMLLDAMNQGKEAVVVTHVGGVYGNIRESIDRFVERYEGLPDEVKRRLVLENDETSYSVSDILDISRRTGIRVVFDYLHHMNNNPDKLTIRDALNRCLDTWHTDIQPKIHFSSPRTELRELKQKNLSTGKQEIIYQPPLLTQHSDYVNPFEYVCFMDNIAGLRDFDIMIEAKAKDLALLKLRENLAGMGLSDKYSDIP